MNVCLEPMTYLHSSGMLFDSLNEPWERVRKYLRWLNVTWGWRPEKQLLVSDWHSLAFEGMGDGLRSS